SPACRRKVESAAERSGFSSHPETSPAGSCARKLRTKGFTGALVGSKARAQARRPQCGIPVGAVTPGAHRGTETTGELATTGTKDTKGKENYFGEFCLTRLQLLVFWTKFSARTFPSSQSRGVRDIQKMDPFRFVADGVVSSAPLRKASRTDDNYGFALSRSRFAYYGFALSRSRFAYYGFALSRSRFAPVCAAFVASRHFFDAQPLLRLRAIALALRALLCEEGNRTHSSSVQTATSSPLVA